MTNIILLSTVLVTNWNGYPILTGISTNGLYFTKTIESGSVYRVSELGFISEKRTNSIGTVWTDVGRINRTNGVPGPIITRKDEDK